jgi:hypothetical protein
MSCGRFSSGPCPSDQVKIMPLLLLIKAAPAEYCTLQQILLRTYPRNPCCSINTQLLSENKLLPTSKTRLAPILQSFFNPPNWMPLTSRRPHQPCILYVSDNSYYIKNCCVNQKNWQRIEKKKIKNCKRRQLYLQELNALNTMKTISRPMTNKPALSIRADWVCGSISRQKKAHTTVMRHIRRTKNMILPTIFKLYAILTCFVKKFLPILTFCELKYRLPSCSGFDARYQY